MTHESNSKQNKKSNQMHLTIKQVNNNNKITLKRVEGKEEEPKQFFKQYFHSNSKAKDKRNYMQIQYSN